MPLKKTHKRKKGTRYRGRNMGTHGTGARKNKRKSGNKGGVGLAGSGKRADHRKTWIIKHYGSDYFGKAGFTSKSTKKDKRQRINLQKIQYDLQKMVEKGVAQKQGTKYTIDLNDYKILGEGEIKEKVIINGKEASKTAMEKVKKAGGEIKLPEKKEAPKKASKEEKPKAQKEGKEKSDSKKKDSKSKKKE